MPPSRRALFGAASTPALPASRSRIATANGAASTSIFAAPSAAALFGDARKVRYTPLTAQQRFTALQSGEVDILSRNTTWTFDARRQSRTQLRRHQFLRRPGVHGDKKT